MSKIGFIGTGNMGYAMIKGIAGSLKDVELVYTDVNKDRLEQIKSEIGYSYVNSNAECVKNSKYVILAVKPQYYQQVLDDIKEVVTSENIIISIAPGINIEYLKNNLGKNIKIVRAMPNTPALVGQGMSAISFSDDDYEIIEKEMVNNIFKSFGEMVELPEHLMNAVVAVSGSSPAYVYMFIEAMADAGVLFGLPRDTSYKLAAGSVLGSAKMVLETGRHPGELKDAVCSPGGTTIEAVSELEKNGFRSAVIEAMKSCYNKTISF
ncbi:pyrroline-5-carboxylate reductase [Vallitalea longa]|uniref:Pyrroline-5-carboxylate reductase n=1 Tax=Vallitalea longa TaxID=2936439 RepID=A0A9W5YGE3_9FIRM|nr:pyrroline-5-carboxylate reductase [Vallitalea longa]GKX31823.1 pyrroline-5-carboxylate reductase [Vallitalea longa]